MDQTGKSAEKATPKAAPKAKAKAKVVAAPVSAKKAVAPKKAAAVPSGKTFHVVLKRSLIGCTQTQRETVRCLGLRRINHEVTVGDNPATRGQILKVQHLVEVKVQRA